MTLTTANRITLAEILVDWIAEEFEISVEYQTRDQTITYWGYDVLIFPNLLKVHRMIGYYREGIKLERFNPADPNFFLDLKSHVYSRICRIKYLSYIQLYELKVGTWD